MEGTDRETTRRPSLVVSGTTVLLRNSGWNLVGQLLPLIGAVVAMPVLLAKLDVVRLGVVVLAWMIAGTSSFLDLGLGRTTTKLVAETAVDGDGAALSTAVWTSVVVTTGVGLITGAMLAVAAPLLASMLVGVTASFVEESTISFRLLALGIPFVAATACLRGVLEALQRFDLVNYVRAPAGALTYIGPMLAVTVAPRLQAAIVGLVIVRIATAATYAYVVGRVAGLGGTAVTLGSVGRAVRYGAWLTVSGVAGPAVVHLDRFLMGGLVSLASVAYYVTPYEVVTKAWAIPGALATVLFASFARLRFDTSLAEASVLFDRGSRYVFFPLLIISLTLIMAGPTALGIWLGTTFARRSALILQILVLGVFASSWAHIPAVFVQGIGRPDVTAKLYFVELLPYIALLWLAVHAMGIVGAAVAWSTRAVVDAGILFWVAGRQLAWSRQQVGRYCGSAVAASVLLAIAIAPIPTTATWVYLALTMCAGAATGIMILRRLLWTDRGFGAHMLGDRNSRR